MSLSQASKLVKIEGYFIPASGKASWIDYVEIIVSLVLTILKSKPNCAKSARLNENFMIESSHCWVWKCFNGKILVEWLLAISERA